MELWCYTDVLYLKMEQEWQTVINYSKNLISKILLLQSNML